jgi:hypothetical protein
MVVLYVQTVSSLQYHFCKFKKHCFGKYDQPFHIAEAAVMPFILLTVTGIFMFELCVVFTIS